MVLRGSNWGGSTSAKQQEWHLRLAKFFDTTPHYWLNMQVAYDLNQEAAALADDLSQIEVMAA